MARIRTIKPEFCSSADVGALSRDARLFFLQLLTEADDEGRMLWIARRLGGVLYPFDPDVTADMLEAWLAECVGRGMLIHYAVAGVEYVQIANWTKHQKISHAAKSRLPDQCSQGVTIIRGKSREELRKSSGDSPEALRPDLGTGNREGEQGTGNRDSSLRSDSSSPAASTPAQPAGETTLSLVPSSPSPTRLSRESRIEQIAKDAQSAYNRLLAKPNGLLPLCAVINKPRRKAIEKALPTVRQICAQLYGSERVTPTFWAQYFETAAADDFHSGRRKGGDGHENWTPDFEFLLRETVIAKLFDRAMSEAA